MGCIEAKGLSAGYGSKIIAKNVSFTAQSGEITAIIGPNGSGKSTILKTLSGSLKILGGSVLIDGENTENIPLRSRAKKMSVLLTERAHTNLMTCREVIETGRYPYTGYFGRLSEKDKKAVSEAILLTDTGGFAERYFDAVSDGQKQRVMLARAICQEPEILILDEPTSFLDLHHKIVFLDILKRLVGDRRIAVVMSLHELEFVRETADHIVCLKDGNVFAKGSPEEIFTEETITKLFDISNEMFKKYIT